MNIEDNDIAANAEKAFFSHEVTLLQRIKRWVKYFAGTIVTLAVFVLTGSQFNIDFLKQPVTHQAAMAFAFIPPSISFLLFVSKTRLKQKNTDAFIALKENYTNL